MHALPRQSIALPRTSILAAERRGTSRARRRLAARPAAIAPKYFYDRVGCALFGAICELPEYYPTRTERGDLRALSRRDRRGRRPTAASSSTWARATAARRGRGCRCSRRALRRRRHRRDALAAALARMAPEFPELAMIGRRHRLHARPRPARRSRRSAPGDVLLPRLVDRQLRAGRRAALPRRHASALPAPPGSGLLIGVDTRKDPRRLAGRLRRRGRRHRGVQPQRAAARQPLLGSDFDPEAFDHRRVLRRGAPAASKCTSRRRRAQTVTLGGERAPFEAGERIHTENSYKYAPAEFARDAAGAGFAAVRCWQDDAGDFAVFYAAEVRALSRRRARGAAPENCQRASGGKKLR